MKNIKAAILMMLLTNSIAYSCYPSIKFYTNNAWYIGFEYPTISDQLLRDLKELKLLREIKITDDSIISDGKDLNKARKRKKAGIIAGSIGITLLTAIISGFTGYVVGRLNIR